MILSLCCLLLLALLSPCHAILYTTFGPNFTYPVAVERLRNTASLNKTMYNNGTIDPSIPVIRIGASWAEVREYSEFAGLEGFLAFMIDYINLNGGIIINVTDPLINPSINTDKKGTRHYLSLTFARNDASNSYMRLIYNDLATQSNNSRFSSLYSTIPANVVNYPMPVVIAPPYDQLTTLGPLLAGFNQTFLAVSNPDPTSFPRTTDNLFSMLATGDLTYAPALNMVNDAAKLRAASQTGKSIDVVNESYDDYNLFGIKTVCLFAANDSLSQIYIKSVRTWIVLENFKRKLKNATADEMISIQVDSPWNDALINATGYEIVYSDYVQSFGKCSDPVDLLVAIPTPTSGTIVTTALAQSRILPKAVIGLGYNNLRATSDGMTSSNGWITMNPYNLSTSTYPGACIKSALIGITGYFTYAAAVPSLAAGLSSIKISVILYMGAMDMICGALTAAKSLNTTGMRPAFNSLNGKMSVFSAVRFNTNTGINTLVPTNAINQIIKGAAKAIPTALPQNLTYPYTWPWTRTLPGDQLQSKQATTGVLVAIIICVLGAWVSLIVVEQAIFIRRKGGNYKPWLAITAVSLGGVALWCGFFQQSSGLTLIKPDDQTTLDIDWSVNVAMLAALPALLLTYTGLQIVILEIEDTTINQGSEAARAKAEIRLERDEKRKKAALDNRAHLIHLYQSMNWKSLLGGMFIVAAVMCTRITMMYVWKTQSDHTTIVWAWCVSVVMKSLLVPLSVHLFFFAIRYRPLAAFIFASACVGDWQIHVNTTEFIYYPNRTFSDILYSTVVDDNSVTIITGTLAAATCFVFIGLQFSRMQLSRNGLSVLVASLESVIHQQRRALKDDTTTFGKMKAYIDHQCRVIESINLLTPFSAESAFILATQASMASYVRFTAPTHGRRPSTLAKMTRVIQDRDGVETSVVQSIQSNNLMSTSHRNSTQITGVNSLSLVTPINNHVTTGNNGFALSQSSHSPDSSKKPRSNDQFLEPKNRSGSQTGDGTNLARHKSVNQIVPVQSEPSTPLDQSNNISISQPEESPKSVQSFQASTVTMSEVGVENSQFLFTRTSITSSLKPSSHSKPGEMSPLAEEDPSLSKGTPVQHINEPLVRGSVFGSSQSVTSSAVTSLASSPHAQPSRPGRDSVTRVARNSQSINQSGAVNTQSNANKSLKTYEEDCIQLIEQLAAFKRDNFAPTRVASTRSSLSGEDEDETSYSKNLPLILRENSAENMTLPISASSPSLTTLLAHPVCVEVIKQELQSIHSTENLMFWLHATRYRRCSSARLRKLLAHAIFEQFIKEGSPQQININTRQRDSISGLVSSKRHDDAYTCDLFREAEHEVVLLMETNMMKTFAQTAKYRLCAWICYTVSGCVADADLCAEFEKAGSARARKDSLLISSTNESNMSNNQSNRSNIDRTAYVTRTRASLTHADREPEHSINHTQTDNVTADSRHCGHH